MNENFFSLPLICGKNLTTALLRHDAHHLLQPLITCGELPPDQLERCGSFRDSVRTSNTTHNQDFLAADVGHRALGDLDEHGENGLLQGEAQVLGGDDVFAVLGERDLGIKDMSQVIPGHGGLMDRLDSLLATIAPIWLLLHYTVF